MSDQLISIKNIPDLGGTITVNVNENSDWDSVKACVLSFIAEKFPDAPLPKDIKFGNNFRPDRVLDAPVEDAAGHTIAVNWVYYDHTDWLSTVRLPKKCPCGAPVEYRCGACHVIGYCSRDCQREYWRSHKKTCKLLKC